MIVLGIDPGVSGGLAVIDSLRGRALLTLRMPLVEIDGKNRPDVITLQRQLGDLGIERVALERSLTRPQESAAGGLSIGASWGMLLGWTLLSGYPYRAIYPAKWTKAIHGKGYKGKQTTIDWCRSAYPDADLIGSRLGKVPHDGICDAIAIAHFGAGIP